jgi:hypothetical protein
MKRIARTDARRRNGFFFNPQFVTEWTNPIALGKLSQCLSRCAALRHNAKSGGTPTGAKLNGRTPKRELDIEFSSLI